MICVDLEELVRGEHLNEDRVTVVREERQRAEMEEVTELVHVVIIFSDSDKVFDTNTVNASTVETWFVADNHTWTEDGRNLVEADGLWTLVAVEEMANAVTCAMTIVKLVVPEELTCDGVKLRTTCAEWEKLMTEGKMTFEDKGVVNLHLLRRFAEGYGACDVGGTCERFAVVHTHILTARVEEEETLRFQRGV